MGENCPHCGEELSPYDEFFCSHCGESIDRPEASKTQATDQFGSSEKRRSDRSETSRDDRSDSSGDSFDSTPTLGRDPDPTPTTPNAPDGDDLRAHHFQLRRMTALETLGVAGGWTRSAPLLVGGFLLVAGISLLAVFVHWWFAILELALFIVIFGTAYRYVIEELSEPARAGHVLKFRRALRQTLPRIPALVVVGILYTVLMFVVTFVSLAIWIPLAQIVPVILLFGIPLSIGVALYVDSIDPGISGLCYRSPQSHQEF